MTSFPFSIIENYDLVCLAIDELVDDGVLLETDPVTIVTRVSKPPAQDIGNVKNIDLSEQGLLNAWEFAKMVCVCALYGRHLLTVPLNVERSRAVTTGLVGDAADCYVIRTESNGTWALPLWLMLR
jgi:hypothetical protein